MVRLWTREQPTAPGFYWIEHGGRRYVVSVERVGDALYAFSAGERAGARVSNMPESTRWAGPIEAPEEW